MNDRPWLVTWRTKRGGTLRRRFYSRSEAMLFTEYNLFEIHPSSKTMDGPAHVPDHHDLREQERERDEAALRQADPTVRYPEGI